jgi:transketolase
MLEAQGISTRVVSCPSLEIFAAQPAAYQHEILPAGIPIVAVEAAHPMPWFRVVGLRGAVVGIEQFGASAPYQVLYRELGITADNVAAAATRVVGG